MISVLAWMFALLATEAKAQVHAPSAAEFTETWHTIDLAMETTAFFPIELTQQDFETIAKGRVAKRRIREAGPDRAMGAMWTPLNRNLVWVAILDDVHDKLVSSLSEKRLGSSAKGHKLLYQHFDLPWPIQDRQLVVQIQNNEPIAKQTANVLWERSWSLADPNAMPDPDPEAVWVPVANGSWLLFPVKNGTVVVYHGRSAIGGRIPDEVVTRWALATVDEMMLHITERAAQISQHYRVDHEILMGGDGKKIYHF